MTDMTAFETLIAEDVRDEVGPEETIDAFAIARKARADSTRWTFPSMFSALKLVVAGGVVALFGGLLLVGVLTTQQGDEMAPAAVTESPSPMTTEELLSGMDTEEVEPGVLRILNDGAGHVPGEKEADDLFPRPLERLHIEPDGSVWVVASVAGDDWGRAVDKSVAWQVGVEGRYGQRDGFPGHEYPNRMPSDLTFADAPDGTLWAAGGFGLGSFDGDTWTPHGEDIWANTVEVVPDGAVWAAWPDRIGRLGPDGWEWFDRGDGVPPEVYQFAVLPDGRVFATGSGRLVGFDGEAWQDVQPSGTDSDTKVIGLRVSTDGMLWAHLSDVAWSTDLTPPWLVRGYASDRSKAQQHSLARFDGDAWAVYSTADGVPRLTGPNSTPIWDVHPDGSVWVLAQKPYGVRSLWSFDGTEWTEHSETLKQFTIGPDGTVWTTGSDGVASFDGGAWTRYERPKGVETLAIASDGTAWAVGHEDESILYVITPEAVAAKE